MDFSAFPQKFIDLIELCIREEANTSPRLVSGCYILDDIWIPYKYKLDNSN